jgi:hypothetical protein
MESEQIQNILSKLRSLNYLIKKMDIRLIEVSRLLKGEKVNVKYKKATLIERETMLDFK